VLLTRDEQGEPRAFVNACAHRGAPVAQGSGRQARGLVCPFHGWAYHLDGTLRARPEDDSFSTSAADCALTPLPVSERCGVVSLGLDPAMGQSTVDDVLASISEDLETAGLADCRPLERRRYTVAANWKLVNDLSLESYHFKNLHRDSVAQVLYANAVVDTYGRHSRWAFPLQTIVSLADIAEAEWPDAVQGSITYTLYPGVMFLTNALGAQMIRAEPGRHPGEAVVTYAGMYRTNCDAAAARQAYEFGGDVFAREDLPMAEACQRGLAAGQRDLLLGRNEPLLQFWHRLWHEATSEEN
jgi:phenylpropionate dioxygenase-like ring-hydroxylating dioxygenase large terminal subunit